MNARVLIAEGSPYLRTLLKDLLAENSCDVVGETDNGNDAIRLYTELNPDLTVLDITMPGENSIAVMKDIKQAAPEAIVVVMGAMGQQDLVADAVKNGADDFLVKPFQAEQVAEVIKRATADKKQ